MIGPGTIAIIALAAGVGAVISAILGLAGGILLLAVMLALGLDPAVAIPLHALVQLVANVTRVATLARHVAWRDVAWFAPPVAAFVFVGAWLRPLVSTEMTSVLLGVLLLITLFAPRQGATWLSRRTAIILAGALSGVFGIIIGAIGPIITLLFLRPDRGRHELIGTTAACSALAHIAKLAYFGVAGFSLTTWWPLLVPMIAAAILGTQVGRRLLDRLSERRFRQGVVAVLALIAVRLLATPFLP